MPTLLLHYPEKEKRWKVEVQKDRFTVGRSREVDVCIPHSSVSKKHLAIEKRGPRFFFRDLGSKNGIYWNDFRRESGSLADGDELRLGSIVIKFFKKGVPPHLLEALAPAAGRPPEGERAGGSTVGVSASSIRAALDAAPAPDPAAVSPPRIDSDPDPLLAELPPSLDDVPLPAEDPPRAEVEPEAPAPARTPDDESARAREREPPSGPELPAETAAEPAAGRHPVRPPSRGRPAARPAPRPADDPALEAPPPARRSLTTPLILATAACIGLGVFLGYLAALIERGGEPGAAGPTSPAAGREAVAPVPATATTAATTAGPGGAAPEKAANEPLGPPARMEDLETRRRLAVRLYLDLAGRSPTRDELADLVFKPDLQALWYEIASKGGAREIRAQGLDAVFRRFLGREAKGEEKEALLALAGNDLDQLAFLVGTSSAYASAPHRRKRTELQLARSLITDLLGVPPAAGAAAKAAEGLRGDPQAVAAVAGAIAGTGESKAAPLPGEPLEAWIEGTYARLLLRKPTVQEKEKALADLKAGPEAWRQVLLGLVTRSEYLTY